MGSYKNTNESKGLNWVIPLACAVVMAAFAMVLILPESREIFRELSAAHPMIMGFVKFALLATIGEMLAMRMRQNEWSLPFSLGWRMMIWGIIGAVLAIMLKMYSGGVDFLMDTGILPGNGNGFVKAFATSVFMNVTFGPVMMAFHKMTDTYLELRHEGISGKGIGEIVENVDWNGFVSFVILKTVPFFWIPAHTVTFLLPAEYQTIMAAFLSMALGVLLCLKKTPSMNFEGEGAD